MIRKLLLIRKRDMTSTLLDEAGLLPYVVGEPLTVHPAAWDESAGLSHYGFVLEMKFKGWANDVEPWIKANPGCTLLDLIVNKKERTIEDALKSVGLETLVVE